MFKTIGFLIYQYTETLTSLTLFRMTGHTMNCIYLIS